MGRKPSNSCDSTEIVLFQGIITFFKVFFVKIKWSRTAPNIEPVNKNPKVNNIAIAQCGFLPSILAKFINGFSVEIK